jgi:uncharacterized protein YcfJ
MKITKLIATVFALTSFTSLTLAGNNYRNADYSYAPVVDVQPVYEQYQVPQDRQICEDYRGRQHPNNQQSNGGGAFLGAVLGGVIGNRFGKGNGRKASTAVGAVIGASIGSQAKSSKHSYNNQRRSCYTQRDYIIEERISGYEVSYDYNGRVYQTTMQNHPGDRVRIQVSHQIADY